MKLDVPSVKDIKQLERILGTIHVIVLVVIKLGRKMLMKSIAMVGNLIIPKKDVMLIVLYVLNTLVLLVTATFVIKLGKK